MIISMSSNIPYVNVRFSFGRESLKISANGILDTGCNMTQVPLGVLVDENVSKESINREIERLKLLFANELVNPESSSGVQTPSNITRIDNVDIESLGGLFTIPSMLVRLALTADSRFMLLGYDFIMSHNILLNMNRRFAIDRFDYSYYNSLSDRNVVDINEVMSYLSI